MMSRRAVSVAFVTALLLSVPVRDSTADAVPVCEGQPATGAGTRGTPGDDVIIGTAGRDVIDGGGGRDIICGLGGDDVVIGGQGADTLYGGAGKDILSGGLDNDVIRGDAGADRLRGGPGSDDLNGDYGDDDVRGEGDHDVSRGGPGFDLISGQGDGNSRDELHGDDNPANTHSADICVVGVGDSATASCDEVRGAFKSVSVLDPRFGATNEQDDPDDLVDSDDLEAMQRAADFLCLPENRDITLVYPPGHYYINGVVAAEQTSSANPRDRAVVYEGCQNIRIRGEGAIIHVNGDFVKKQDEGFSSCTADQHQYSPFAFRNVEGLWMSGFVIDGEGERTKVAEPSVHLCEGPSHGVFLLNENRYVTLQDLLVRGMTTDGINVNEARDLTIRRVRSANNNRAALSLHQVRNVLVTDSYFVDTGMVGTSHDSYPVHSPGAGVDFEPECAPAGTEWVDPANPCTSFVGLPGNILFDRVSVTGNQKNGIIAAYGERLANVTVRNSLLQNPMTGEIGSLLNIGAVGAVIEHSTLDSQRGTMETCNGAKQDLQDVQIASPRWAELLQDLAADESPIAQMMYRQTDPGYSIRLVDNTIRGQANIWNCGIAIRTIIAEENRFISDARTDMAPEALAEYNSRGAINFTGSICQPTTRNQSVEVRIERNSFFIPSTAPPAPGNGGTDSPIRFCGPKGKFRFNEFTTDSVTPSQPFKVWLDHIQTVEEDRYPVDGTIVPVYGAWREGQDSDAYRDRLARKPYKLTTDGLLNFPSELNPMF